MRNIGMALFLFCVGAAGCTSASDGGIGQGQQAEVGKLAICANSFAGPTVLCAAGLTCVSSPNPGSLEVDGPGICVENPTAPLQSCGGFAGLQCSAGFSCVDDPIDE
ncbi:MAG: hypothetical protein ACMG6S_28875, partial [Byssovorax sp.]